MNRQREFEEIVKIPDTGRTFRLAATWGFVRELSLSGEDLSIVYNELVEGLLPPVKIKDVIKFALIEADGKEITGDDRESAAIEILEDGGLIDSSLLARHLIGHIVLGRVKKKQLQNNETVNSITKDLQKTLGRSRWKTFMLLGLLWAAPLLISITALCMSFSRW